MPSICYFLRTGLYARRPSLLEGFYRLIKTRCARNRRPIEGKKKIKKCNGVLSRRARNALLAPGARRNLGGVFTRPRSNKRNPRASPIFAAFVSFNCRPSRFLRDRVVSSFVSFNYAKRRRSFAGKIRTNLSEVHGNTEFFLLLFFLFFFRISRFD